MKGIWNLGCFFQPRFDLGVSMRTRGSPIRRKFTENKTLLMEE
jgi:hypothetical protein